MDVLLSFLFYFLLNNILKYKVLSQLRKRRIKHTFKTQQNFQINLKHLSHTQKRKRKKKKRKKLHIHFDAALTYEPFYTVNLAPTKPPTQRCQILYPAAFVAATVARNLCLRYSLHSLSLLGTFSNLILCLSLLYQQFSISSIEMNSDEIQEPHHPPQHSLIKLKLLYLFSILVIFLAISFTIPESNYYKSHHLKLKTLSPHFKKILWLFNSNPYQKSTQLSNPNLEKPPSLCPMDGPFLFGWRVQLRSLVLHFSHE